MTIRPPCPSLPRDPARSSWCSRIFAAKAAETGGIVRRSIRDVEREIGRATLEAEVKRRGFHLIESGGQFLIICHTGHFRLVC